MIATEGKMRDPGCKPSSIERFRLKVLAARIENESDARIQPRANNAAQRDFQHMYENLRNNLTLSQIICLQSGEKWSR